MKAVTAVNIFTAISKWPYSYCKYNLFLATKAFRKPQHYPTRPQKYFASHTTRSYLSSINI